MCDTNADSAETGLAPLNNSQIQTDPTGVYKLACVLLTTYLSTVDVLAVILGGRFVNSRSLSIAL